jgi:hypothetical protein
VRRGRWSRHRWRHDGCRKTAWLQRASEQRAKDIISASRVRVCDAAPKKAGCNCKNTQAAVSKIAQTDVTAPVNLEGDVIALSRAAGNVFLTLPEGHQMPRERSSSQELGARRYDTMVPAIMSFIVLLMIAAELPG